ncbi:MAG: Cu(I)-responsive transcriptional regulator [Burkholderiaceae bacterium]
MNAHHPHETGLNIGATAARTGVSAKMIRHYESLGLLPPVARTANGYRVYTERDLRALGFIRRARKLGFGMAEIGELVGHWHNERRASAEVKKIAQAHIAELEQKMSEMAAMKEALEVLVGQCQGNQNSACSIIDALAPAEVATPAAR